MIKYEPDFAFLEMSSESTISSETMAPSASIGTNRQLKGARY